MAQLDAPSGSLIAYATAPSSVAADGAGKNGLYTANLLRAMKLPGLSLEQVFKRIRAAVRQETDGQQTPWESTSLEGDFYFLPAAAATANVAQPQPAPVRQDSVVQSPPVDRPQPETGRIERSNLPTLGEGNRGLMFVLDASGSMWGQVEEQPKITIAKSVLGELVQQSAEDTDLGLVVYGHRRKGDCEDVETLLPLTGNAKPQVIAALDTLNPKGKTPLTASVQQAIEQLRTREDAVAVVVVSDGLESCGGDPCAAVVAAHDAGIAFVMHTVGFGLQEAETAELRCMAEAGGGQFFTADTATSLMKGLKTAVKVDFKEGWVNLLATSNGALAKARIEIFESGTEQRVVWKDTSDTDKKRNPQKLKLAPGEYDFKIAPLDIKGTEAREIKSVAIRPGATHIEKLDFPHGILEFTGLVNGNLGSTRLEVFAAGTEQRVLWKDTSKTDKKRNPFSVKLRPGQYDFKVSALDVHGVEPWEKANVTIQPAATLSEGVDFAQGDLQVGVLENGKMAVGRIEVFVSGTEQRVVWKDTSKTDKKRNPENLRLNPGEYDVRVSANEVQGLDPWEKSNVIIRPETTVPHQIDFPQGVLEFGGTVNGKLGVLRIEVFRSGTEQRVVWKDTSATDKKHNPTAFKLGPGSYDIKVTANKVLGAESRLLENFQIKAAQTHSINEDFARGTIAVMTTANGKPIKSRIEIYEADSEIRVSWRDTSDRDKKRNPFKFDLAPNRYDVRVSATGLAGAEPIVIQGIQLGAQVEEALAAEF